MNLDAIYAPTSQASEQSTTLRFPIMEWRVYDMIAAGACSQAARALANQLSVSPEGMAAILERLHRAGLIHVPEVGYEEFKTASAPSPVHTPMPSPAREVRSPAGVSVGEDAQGSVNFTLRRRPKPSAPPTREDEPLKLGMLVHLVRERAGGGSLGQLAVYRMFLKIPQELMQSAGLEKLDLDATDLEVSSPPLVSALRDKACEILGVPPQELAALLV